MDSPVQTPHLDRLKTVIKTSEVCQILTIFENSSIFVNLDNEEEMLLSGRQLSGDYPKVWGKVYSIFLNKKSENKISWKVLDIDKA